MQSGLNELEIIENILKEAGVPLSINKIQQRIGFIIEPRTLRRRLVQLQNKKLVKKTGDKKGAAYQITSNESESGPQDATSLITLSDESKELVMLVDRSLQSRNPAGYNRNFLDLYEPNYTNYLTNDEKEKLAETGKTARQNEPAGTYAKDILQRLLIDLSWNSSRLEGNTYSLLDTERLISLGEQANNKSAKEAQMILNHKDAIEFIVVNTENIGFNRYTLLNIHALLSNNLLPDPAASGRLRTFGVGIHQSVYTPLAMPQMIEEMFHLILAKTNQIEDPFEQAFFMMVHLPYLQPFDDVNKRVSRLAANIPLNLKNLVPISFVDVPDTLYIKGLLAVYELNRVELLKDVFLWAYERSSARYSSLRQSLGEPDPFRMQYREQIRSLIAEIVPPALPYRQAAELIQKKAAQTPERDRSKFIEAVETELITLHEGNIARYRIRPAEFLQWKAVWNKT